MSDLLDFIEFVDYARRFRQVGPRRYLRDYSDPFTKYSVQEFHARYRFTPESVKNVILPMLASDLSNPTKRGLPFAPEIMLLLTLRYFATGSFQKMDGDVMNICQQSVSRIIAKVSALLASKMKDFVKFPSSVEEINTVKQKFYELAHFPGVIGCIDCTHIKIRSPGGITSEIYRNRKGWFSINVQAVTGPNLEFYDLVARWPGMGMGIKVDTVVSVICACATLNNIALLVDELVPLNWDNIDIQNDVVDVAPITVNPNSNGFIVRQSLVE
ncbi:Uncharacterized protein OBRU01_25937, partial [Operophtera brumata]